MTEAATRRLDVFFYGLFMDEALLREKGMNPTNRRMTSVENFSLVIGERATLFPSPGQTVHGVVFSLTHAEVDELYGEASVSVYRPEAILARLADGNAIPALCFNLPVPPSREERNPQYVARLREVASRIGLPPEYVSSALSSLSIHMNNKKLLRSDRLTLIAATLAHVRTELESPEQLATLLDAAVSTEWPTGEYDRDAMEFFRARLEEGGEEVEGWYGWYAVREADSEGPRTLVGSGGYFGPPDGEGTVEIGYSVLPLWQRRGYASEIVRMLLQHAFTFSHVERVIAHATEANPASISVLLRSGFRAAGAGSEPGTLRFEFPRTPALQQLVEPDDPVAGVQN